MYAIQGWGLSKAPSTHPYVRRGSDGGHNFKPRTCM